MRVLYIPFFLFFLLGTVTAAAQANFTQILTELPACSIDCILKGLSSVPDAFSNLTTTCTNVTLQASISACIQMKCSYNEQAQVAILDQQLCEGVPIQSRAAVGIVGLVCGPIAIFAIALRCYSRYSLTRSLGWDDWLAVATGVVLIPLIMLDYYNGTLNEYGRHYWNINPLKIPGLLKTFYIGEILYVLAITLVKASILAFYFRVFPARNFRIAAGIVMLLVVFAGIGIIAATVFQCTPIDLAWNRRTVGRCINVNELAYAAGAISVALDIIILVLPLPELYHLHMNKKKKLNLMLMFSLGTIACITSIIRLNYLVNFAKSTDPSWDIVIPGIWSFLEICVATICACLPAIRAILSRYLPSFFLFTFDNSNEPKPSTHPSTGTSPSLILQNVSDPRSRSGYSSNRRGYMTPNSKLLSPTSPNFSNFTSSGRFSNYNNLSSPRVDLENGTGTRGSMSVRASSAVGSSGSGTLGPVWINPKFDGEGNILDYQRTMTTLTKDEGYLPDHGSLSDECGEDYFEVPINSGATDEDFRGSQEGRSSETSTWVVEGPRESEENSDRHSDAILELRDPPKELQDSDSVKLKNTFGRLRGGGGRERLRDRFMPKVQRLMAPLPLGTNKKAVVCR